MDASHGDGPAAGLARLPATGRRARSGGPPQVRARLWWRVGAVTAKASAWQRCTVPVRSEWLLAGCVCSTLSPPWNGMAPSPPYSRASWSFGLCATADSEGDVYAGLHAVEPECLYRRCRRQGYRLHLNAAFVSRYSTYLATQHDQPQSRHQSALDAMHTRRACPVLEYWSPSGPQGLFTTIKASACPVYTASESLCDHAWP